MSVKKKYRLLVWQPNACMSPFFKSIQSANAEIRNLNEFGFTADYNSQYDFDRIETMFHPDIVILESVDRNSLNITIPENIYVWIYFDHFIEQFKLIGKAYFEQLPKNDFIYLPVLNPEKADRDRVLRRKQTAEKVIIEPFVPFTPIPISAEEGADGKELEKYKSDVCIVTNLKSCAYYGSVLGLSSSLVQGRALTQFLGILVPAVRSQLLETEQLTLERRWIERTVIDYFDRYKVWQYSRNHEKMLEVWRAAIEDIVIPTENTYCIAKWLDASELNFKVWGRGWEKEPWIKRRVGGETSEASRDLYSIYSNSKIAVNTNSIMGIHRKTFEAIQLGCLNLQADARAGNMYSDYKPYFSEGKSIVTFSNKRELMKQVEYYLSHEMERRKITEGSRDAVKRLNWNTGSVVTDAFAKLIDRIDGIKQQGERDV